VSPVYSYETIKTPKYKLDKSKHCIMLEVHKTCNNVSVLTENHQMTVKQINDELKALAKTSDLSDDELSKKFKYLITATQPNQTIVENIEAVSLQTKVKTSEIKEILENLLHNTNLIAESTYLLLLDYSLMLMDSDNNQVNKHLPTEYITEKHSQMFYTCCRKLFPSKTSYVDIGISLSSDDPFAEETEKRANFKNLIEHIKPETLSSLTVIMPALQTELKYLYDWETSLSNDLEFDTKPQQISDFNTTPMKTMELATMHLPERTINISFLAESFIVWPIIVLLNEVLNQNHSLPLFVKLVLIHTALQQTTHDNTSWTMLPLICCTTIINSYTKQDREIENVKYYNNTTAKMRRITYHNDKDLYLEYSNEEKKWKIFGESHCRPYFDSIIMHLIKLKSVYSAEEKLRINQDGWEEL